MTKPLAPALPRVRAKLHKCAHLIRKYTGHARMLVRGSQNILNVWPDEVFEKPLCVYSVFRRRVFVVSDPALIEYVMVTKVENFRKSDASRRMLEPLIGKSMFITHGEHWRRQRRIATPAFHSRHIRAFSSMMVEETQDLLARWEKLGADAEVDVSREMTRLTAEIICRTLFSYDIDDSVERVYDAFARYQDSLGRLAISELAGLPAWLPRPSAWRGRRAAAELDRIVGEIVAQRQRTGEQRSDLLGLLLDAVDPVTGTSLSARLVRDELLMLFLAGHETTANAMVWTWYLLSQSPEAERRLHEELDSVLADRVPRYEDLQQLPWLRAVLQESMRLYPPLHVYSREAVKSDRLGGKPCPAGSMVVIAPWVVQRHRLLWQEPAAFRPERFLPENSVERPRYAWLPFSAGPRTCLGTGFAMTEMMLAAALIAQRYRLRLRPGHPVEPLGRLTLRPTHGLPMRLVPRSPDWQS